MMRPFAAIGDWCPTMVPVATGLTRLAPVSALSALTWPLVPTTQTIASAPCALVMVTIGLLAWVGPPHQAGVIVGGDAAPTLTAIRPPFMPVGQPVTPPLNTKYVPIGVVYPAAAWMIVPVATRRVATGAAPMPPRLLRLRRYALPSFPNARTRADGVAPGTSNSTRAVPPRSVSPSSRADQLDGTQKSLAVVVRARLVPSL